MQMEQLNCSSNLAFRSAFPFNSAGADAGGPAAFLVLATALMATSSSACSTLQLFTSDRRVQLGLRFTESFRKQDARRASRSMAAPAGSSIVVRQLLLRTALGEGQRRGGESSGSCEALKCSKLCVPVYLTGI